MTQLVHADPGEIKPSIPLVCRTMGLFHEWDRKNRGPVSQQVGHKNENDPFCSHNCIPGVKKAAWLWSLIKTLQVNLIQCNMLYTEITNRMYPVHEEPC